jgi:hypothetical protein
VLEYHVQAVQEGGDRNEHAPLVFYLDSVPSGISGSSARDRCVALRRVLWVGGRLAGRTRLARVDFGYVEHPCCTSV